MTIKQISSMLIDKLSQRDYAKYVFGLLGLGFSMGFLLALFIFWD